MIAASSATNQTPQCSHWREALSNAITDPRELVAMLGLRADELPGVTGADHGFTLKVPRGFVSRMRRGDPADPLLRQVLPLSAELVGTPGFKADPVGDLASQTVPGVLHKYHGRVLLIATGACAVHCRYCFRRHFPYQQHNASRNGWREVLHEIRRDVSVSEVILSGGDPLLLTNRRIGELLVQLAEIPHIRRLRLHTRVPIVLPERVDADFCDRLRRSSLTTIVVLHANHANEFDDTVRRACGDLRAAGATLLNQAVLLAGVNDSVGALADLSTASFECGVLPYYLHLLDRVQGASHFEVPEARALELHGELRDRLPGYLVPRLVREIAGASSKTPVMPSSLD